MDASFPVDSIRSVEFSALVPGDLFVYQRGAQRQLCMAAKAHRPDYSCYMILTAGNAFELIDVELRYAKPVLSLGLNSKDLIARFDPLEKVTPIEASHAVGLLQVPRDGQLQIVGVYPDLRDEYFRNAVNLHDGSVERVDGPFFGYTAWRLSFVDRAGAWVNLVDR